MKTLFVLTLCLCASVVNLFAASISNTNAFFPTNSVNGANKVPHENTNNTTLQRTMSSTVDQLFTARTAAGNWKFTGTSNNVSGETRFDSFVVPNAYVAFSYALNLPFLQLTNYSLDGSPEYFINATNGVNISSIGDPSIVGNVNFFVGITITNFTTTNNTISAPIVSTWFSDIPTVLTNGKSGRLVIMGRKQTGVSGVYCYGAWKAQP